MTNIKEEPSGDGSMEDTSPQTISGTVDVANKANDANDIETLRAINAALVQHNVHVQNERFSLIAQANNERNRLINILYARDATIVAANRSLAGKQKQLDSLYNTLQRQENQITTLQQNHAAKLARIRMRMNMMAKKTAKKFEKQAAENAAQTKLWAEDVKLMIAEDIESERDSDVDEETESNGEGEDEEMEVIEINDEDEPAGTEQSTINEQSAVVQQSGKQRATTEQSAVTEQPAADEEQPNKRVKLTNGA